MKGSVILLVLVTVLAQQGLGQQFTSPSLSFANVSSGTSFSPSIVFNADRKQRFNQFSYNDFKINDVQVISVYAPDLQQDRVYFVDKYGNAEGWTLSPSSPVNTLSGWQGSPVDAMNPTGANCVFEALAFGVLNSLFNGKAGIFFK